MATIEKAPWYKCEHPFINGGFALIVAGCCVLVIVVFLIILIFAAMAGATGDRSGFYQGIGISGGILIILAGLGWAGCISNQA